jgi:hypothetical protein
MIRAREAEEEGDLHHLEEQITFFNAISPPISEDTTTIAYENFRAPAMLSTAE